MTNEVINQIRESVSSEYKRKNFKISFDELCYTLKHLFGGEITHHYNEITHVHYFIIINDDVGDMIIDVCNDAFMYEPLQVRISRMCEEYDGYMRYKYRDYEGKII